MIALVLTMTASVVLKAPAPAPAAGPVAVLNRPVVMVPGPTPTVAISHGMVRLYPEEAVMKAAAAAPGFVEAVFDFTVRRAEQVGPNFFLNSEEDYRDPRNISVVLSPDLQHQLRNSFGDDLSKYFVGHHLLVAGAAVRTRIIFADANGKPSDKYYYQTHVQVMNARQLERADRP